MGEAKERLDTLLVELGHFDTREKARKNIMAGLIFVDNNRVDKPGEKVKRNSIIEIKGEAVPYASRGGLKLEKAIRTFNLELCNKVTMDVGASTGGFTDCMLKNGASKVFSIDVGYGQLAWELRTNPKVVCMERTNIRYVKPEDIGEEVDFVSVDVSFISLKLVVPAIKEILKKSGELITLIKPQFEAGRDKVGKKGVVREPEIHEEVLRDVIHYIIDKGFSISDLTYSPIKGPEGNIEYLAYFINDSRDETKDVDNIIKSVVGSSHIELKV